MLAFKFRVIIMGFEIQISGFIMSYIVYLTNLRKDIFFMSPAKPILLDNSRGYGLHGLPEFFCALRVLAGKESRQNTWLPRRRSQEARCLEDRGDLQDPLAPERRRDLDQ